jgi:hypothetical protein
MMKKGKYIYGKAGTGKTYLAQRFAELYKHPVFMSDKDLRERYWGNIGINGDTDLIVIDGFMPRNLDDLQEIIAMVATELKVNRKNYPIFSIHPDFIFVSQFEPPISICRSRHFDVIVTGFKYGMEPIFELNNSNR